MREVIMTGKTVEEATELALAELGVSAEDASEMCIRDRAHTGFPRFLVHLKYLGISIKYPV